MKKNKHSQDNNLPVAVIMSVKNGEKYLIDAIDSILGQSYNNIKLYVVDDGSTDRTHKILEKFNNSKKVTIIVNEVSMGLAFSLNRSLAIITEPYIARMDADDVCEKDRILIQLNAMIKLGADVCGSAATIIDTSGEKIGVLENNAYTDREIKSYLLRGNPLIHPSVMFKNNPIIRYDESIGPAQDYELWLRLINNVKFINLPDRLLRYRMHSESITLTRKYEQNKNHSFFRRKHIEYLSQSCSYKYLKRKAVVINKLQKKKFLESLFLSIIFCELPLWAKELLKGR